MARQERISKQPFPSGEGKIEMQELIQALKAQKMKEKQGNKPSKNSIETNSDSSEEDDDDEQEQSLFQAQENKKLFEIQR